METPPRAWGRHPPHRPDSGPVGNTPTSVGKTLHAAKTTTRWGKHPHERGEDLTPALNGPKLVETPPRAWGRRPSPRADPCGSRNTPTSVGKTLLVVVVAAVDQKHPHERGEDYHVSERVNDRGGNTPTSVGKTG